MNTTRQNGIILILGQRGREKTEPIPALTGPHPEKAPMSENGPPRQHTGLHGAIVSGGPIEPLSFAGNTVNGHQPIGAPHYSGPKEPTSQNLPILPQRTYILIYSNILIIF